MRAKVKIQLSSIAAPSRRVRRLRQGAIVVASVEQDRGADLPLGSTGTPPVSPALFRGRRRGTRKPLPASG